MGFEAFLDGARFLFCLHSTLRSSWLGLWSNNTIYIFLFTVMSFIGIIIRLNSFMFEEAFENLQQKSSTETCWHSSVLRQIPKWQNLVMRWKGERESPKESADPADSPHLRKSGNWVIKQTSQVMRVWSLLNGTDTVAPPGERGTPVSCVPTRGILRRYGNWRGSGWYMWAALWFPSLPGQLFPGWLQYVSPQPLSCMA